MIRSLEGLRGLAALFVALFHLRIGAAVLPAVRYGYLFVDLFFVLSGFVIASAYSQRLQTPRQAAGFMLRRFGRLFPLLVFSSILFVLAGNAVTFTKIQMVAQGAAGALKNPGDLAYVWPSAGEIASTLTLTHAMGWFDHDVMNFVSWSISTEFWAYAFFAATCLLFVGGRRTAVLIVASAVMFALTVWHSLHVKDCIATAKCLGETYDFGYARCLFSFLMGATVWRYRSGLRQHAPAVQIASAAALAILFAAVGRAPAVAFLVPFVFAALIWSLAEDSGPLARALGDRVGLFLGERSYSVYMLHPVLLFGFLQLAQRAAHPAAAVVVVVLYVAALLVCAGWSYRFIEAPARRYFNALAARLEASRPAAAVTA